MDFDRTFSLNQNHVAGNPLLATQCLALDQQLGRGVGWCFGHHGEEVQGQTPDDQGRQRRFLISIPDPSRGSVAVLELRSRGGIVVSPAGCTKARRAARLSLNLLGHRGGARLNLWSNIRARLGCGRSTADVTATIRSAFAAFGCDLNPRIAARLAVQAETASDSMMFDTRAVAFCQREGRVLEDFRTSFPSIEILGFSTDARGVDTLDLPLASYDANEVATFVRLLAEAREGFRTRDTRLLIRVATESARISQRHLPKPKFAEIERLADDIGAGIQVSHSGSVVGLMLRPDTNAIEDRIVEAGRRVVMMGFGRIHRFNTGLTER